MLFCNGGSFLGHLIQGAPVLVFDGDGDAPVIGMFRNRIGVELIVNDPTLLFVLIVERPEILFEVVPVLVVHARFNVYIRDSPNWTVIEVGTLCNCWCTRREKRRSQTQPQNHLSHLALSWCLGLGRKFDGKKLRQCTDAAAMDDRRVINSWATMSLTPGLAYRRFFPTQASIRASALFR